MLVCCRDAHRSLKSVHHSHLTQLSTFARIGRSFPRSTPCVRLSGPLKGGPFLPPRQRFMFPNRGYAAPPSGSSRPGAGVPFIPPALPTLRPVAPPSASPRGSPVGALHPPTRCQRVIQPARHATPNRHIPAGAGPDRGCVRHAVVAHHSWEWAGEWAWVNALEHHTDAVASAFWWSRDGDARVAQGGWQATAAKQCGVFGSRSPSVWPAIAIPAQCGVVCTQPQGSGSDSHGCRRCRPGTAACRCWIARTAICVCLLEGGGHSPAAG